MKRTRTALVSVALLATSIGMAGCGTSGGGAGASGSADGCPKGDINWWVQMPLSGPVAAVGEASTESMQAAVDVVNKDGGVLGHDIKLVKKDSAADPTKAVSNLQSMLASGDRPTIVTPGLLSTEVLAALPLVSSAKMVSVIISSSPETNSVQKYPYSFNLATSSTKFSTPALVQELTSRGYKKFGVAVADDATGASQLKELQDASKGGGFSVDAVTIPLDTIDPVPQLSKLRAKNPDVLVYATGPGPLTPATLKARQTMGWNIPTHGNTVSSSAPLAGLPPQAVDGVTFTVPKFGISGSTVQQSSGYKTYIAAENKRFGGTSKLVLGPEIYAGPYSMIIAGAAAMNKAKSCDPTKVKAAFEGLQVADAPQWFLSSSFDFSKNNHAVAYAKDDYQSIPATSALTDGSFVVK